MTTASTSITSSLTFFTRSLRFLRSFPFILASFFPKRAVVDVSTVGLKVKELVVCVVAVDLALVPTVKACTLVAAKKRKEMQMRRKDFMVVVCLVVGSE